MAGLADRVDALERAVASGGGKAALGALGSKFDRLAQQVAGLDRRLAGLEERVAASGPARLAMWLAVGQLHGALRGSGPFEAELDALRAVAVDDAEVAAVLDRLAARAAGGLPTVEMLRADFSAIADAIVRASYVPDEGSWQGWTIGWLAKLVTVRRVGDDMPGDSVDGIVARAEERLAAGDLAAAVAVVQRLAGPPAEVSAGWLANARARLAADRALAALDARAIAALGAAGEGG